MTDRIPRCSAWALIARAALPELRPTETMLADRIQAMFRINRRVAHGCIVSARRNALLDAACQLTPAGVMWLAKWHSAPAA